MRRIIRLRLRALGQRAKSSLAKSRSPEGRILSQKMPHRTGAAGRQLSRLPCQRHGRAAIMKARSAQQIAEALTSIETVAPPKAPSFSSCAPRNRARTRRFCSNSLPIPITPITTGAASACMGITDKASCRAIASPSTGLLSVSSSSGNCLLLFGQSRTATHWIMPRILIWNFIPNFWRTIGWC